MDGIVNRLNRMLLNVSIRINKSLFTNTQSDDALPLLVMSRFQDTWGMPDSPLVKPGLAHANATTGSVIEFIVVVVVSDDQLISASLPAV